ncbi:MAG: DNA helicase UvrD [Desulfobacteraceae bacterium]|nr:MAG: DNA helicase UvrD [Desulfobacteraceae bacterium]
MVRVSEPLRREGIGDKMGPPNITLISASAGSGKTYRLIEKLAEALNSGLDPEGVLATTFTNKAAAELTERVRTSLLGQREWEKAQRIFDGYIGTVNSVCGRLLKDFALEAGLSPTLDVLPEGEDKAIYEKAIAPVVQRHAPEIDPIAQRFEVDNWRNDVKSISDLARTNNITPESLKESATRSLKTFQKLLPKAKPEVNESQLDQSLFEAIAEAVKQLKDNLDQTKATQGVLELLQKLLRRQRPDHHLSWRDWVRLSKLSPGAKSRAIVAPVIEAAAVHPRHPRFQRDVKNFILRIFSCAAEAIQNFANFKREHGLIDFVDQETLCFQLLQNPEVRAQLQEQVRLVLVDEFQDTSPIQLAVFLQLAQVADHAIWVGDQKQSIYGFRGTDPLLMDAVIENLIGPENFEILTQSYRSRPGLVTFTNALFAEAFQSVGIPGKRVTLQPVREEVGQAHPLHAWWLQAKNNNEETGALAAAVGSMIARAVDFQVIDKATKQPRPLRGGDMAILCRTNDRCSQVAEALENLGVRVMLPRSGLLARPECILALACLRYLVDASDSLAVAEILHLTEDPSTPRQWFSHWLTQHETPPWKSNAIILNLEAEREKLLHLTPSEALQLAISAGMVSDRVVLWGDSSQRLANLEMLRSLACKYEEKCLIARSAGTPAGLVTFLASEEEKTELDKQAESHDEHSVQVLTYHRAKGLEWPVVILGDLQAVEKDNPFGVDVSPSDKPFDVNNPLSGRWIRFWPWPYGSQKVDVGLDEAIKESEERKAVLMKEKKELMRLLYMGMTRARDYLVFAARDGKKSSTAWLDSLKDGNGDPIFTLPSGTGEKTIEIGRQAFQFYSSSFQPLESQWQKETGQVNVSATIPQKKPFLPARLTASKAGSTFFTFTIKDSQSVTLGSRLPLHGRPDMTLLGEVFHRFLAADDPPLGHDQRLDMARELLINWGADGLEPEALVVAGDRLWNYLRNNYGPECTCHREWPVHLRIGEQKLSGWIDLLIDTGKGFIVVDHKSFPGRVDQWPEKAKEYAPQLLAYRKAMEKATGRPVIETCIHMPILGVMLKINLDENDI